MSADDVEKVVLDTSVLLDDISSLDAYEHIIICVPVLEELDNFKDGRDVELAFKARQVLKKIESNKNIEYDVAEYVPSLEFDRAKRDNHILFCAGSNKCKLVSNDVTIRIKAKALNIETEAYKRANNENIYKGFTEVELPDSDLADWYETDKKENKWDLLNNEYLLIKQDNKIVDKWKFTVDGFKQTVSKKINPQSLDKFKPLDDYQSCALDSLLTNKVTMIKGKAGTGKTLLSLSYAMDMVEESKKYDRLIIFVNPIDIKNSARLGFYPGSRDEKLLFSNSGNMLISKFGDRMAIERLMGLDKLIILPFSDIRGYDTSGKRAIVYIPEAQNLDINLMKIAIQRVGNDCQIIVDGDYNTQVDSNAFVGSKNGMKRLSEVFRGQDCYGEVELQKIYRSKMAEIADRL